MSDNYAVINGKRVELTDEQLKMLRIEIEGKRKNPFEKGTGEKEYYFINSGMGIARSQNTKDPLAATVYAALNYFTDKDFAKQVSLHQLLYRKLLKYAYDNECEDTAEWDGSNKHWAVRYDYACGMFTTYYQNAYGAQEVYFSSEEGARRAIKEVVDPFMKEYPEFVW